VRSSPPDDSSTVSGKRRRWAGTAAAAILLIAFFALFWPRPSPTSAEGAQALRKPLADLAAEKAAISGDEARDGATEERLREEDRVPMPGCWQGLRDFDRNASLSDMRAAIAAAVESADPLLAGYLRERLTEMIGDDPAHANRVLAWAREASGPELGLLLGALKDSPAVRDPGVADRTRQGRSICGARRSMRWRRSIASSPARSIG
jgi:hypothetical protein